MSDEIGAIRRDMPSTVHAVKLYRSRFRVHMAPRTLCGLRLDMSVVEHTSDAVTCKRCLAVQP